MTNEQAPDTAATDYEDFTDVRTVTVLPGSAQHRTDHRATADADVASEEVDGVEYGDLVDVSNHDIREYLPAQRTPGDGPFGPGDLWDVTRPPEFVTRLEDRLEGGEPVALVAFGMDRFQQLNFSQGVEAGDVALRNAYRVLRWILGPSNVAYFGSDCFAALLSYDDVETTTDLVGTALHRLARTDLSDRLTGVFATASAGVIVIDDPEATADGALYEAECLLLAAKDMGGNRVVIERLSRTYAGVESA